MSPRPRASDPLSGRTQSSSLPAASPQLGRVPVAPHSKLKAKSIETLICLPDCRPKTNLWVHKPLGQLLGTRAKAPVRKKRRRRRHRTVKRAASQRALSIATHKTLIRTKWLLGSILFFQDGAIRRRRTLPTPESRTSDSRLLSF